MHYELLSALIINTTELGRFECACQAYPLRSATIVLPCYRYILSKGLSFSEDFDILWIQRSLIALPIGLLLGIPSFSFEKINVRSIDRKLRY